ncbi:MAG: outer membrane protein assembly factor BamE [Variovorax sp.]|nr:MAG: outer membrane protein assembly factor BamE [Variovorax sp.]
MKKLNLTRRNARLTLCAIALLALQGCTSYVSKGIADDGKTAAELVFQPLTDAWQPEGIFPNKDNLRAVRPGMSKDQLYDLIGRPHFNEGLVAVREWDYSFHFRTGGGAVSCRYKVLFDRDYRAQSFHWEPSACASFIAEPPLAAPVAPVPAPIPKAIQLSADALFAFDRAALQDLLPSGRRELDRIAVVLGGAKVEHVRIVGHTDRLGAVAYNQQLSEARAATVRAYLIGAGVPGERLAASGRGAREPVVQCQQAQRDDLIACLAPNRRVEIVVKALDENTR